VEGDERLSKGMPMTSFSNFKPYISFHFTTIKEKNKTLFLFFGDKMACPP